MPTRTLRWRSVTAGLVTVGTLTAAGCGVSNPPVEAEEAFSRPINLGAVRRRWGADWVARAVRAEMANQVDTDMRR